jgi:hypothetical protein
MAPTRLIDENLPAAILAPCVPRPRLSAALEKLFINLKEVETRSRRLIALLACEGMKKSARPRTMSLHFAGARNAGSYT